MILAIAAAFLLDDAAAAEATLFEACRAKGGTERECACGLDIAREALTPRELALFAALTPYLERDDLAAALPEALARADALGYSPGEVASAIAVVYEHAERVEAACAEDAAG